MRWIKKLGVGLLVLAVLASVVPYLIPMPGRDLPPRKSPFVNGRIYEACGLRWHVQRWSPSATEAKARVVLLHGFAGSTFSWRLTGPALADAGYEVLALDMPPFGYGDRAEPERPLPACIAGIVTDEAGDLPVMVVGHSRGAAVAARLSVELANRARALVLVDGGLASRGRAAAVVGAWAMRVPPLARWAEVIAHHGMLEPARFARSLASAYGREPSEAELDGYRTPLLLAGTAARVFAGLADSGPLDQTALPRNILLVWGKQDSWVPAQVAERTRAELPRARLSWIENAGHNPMETHPAEFMAALLPFLDSSLADETPGNADAP